MIEDLRETLTSMLAGVTWMDETTRQSAIAKVWRNEYLFDLGCVCVCLRARACECVCYFVIMA